MIVPSPGLQRAVSQTRKDMCQMRVVVEKEGKEGVMLENVTRLDVIEQGVAVATLFEGSREIVGAVLRRIDFLGGKVYLSLG